MITLNDSKPLVGSYIPLDDNDEDATMLESLAVAVPTIKNAGADNDFAFVADSICNANFNKVGVQGGNEIGAGGHMTLCNNEV